MSTVTTRARKISNINDDTNHNVRTSNFAHANINVVTTSEFIHVNIDNR